MKLYSKHKDYKLYQGSMLDMLEIIEPNSIDSIVTDPPYELNFMGKGWDNAGVSFQVDTWKQCFEALKPGGYLLAFGGSRTFHRIACAIEDAGFEIRDTIMWLYGSGFPKSMNIGLAIDKKNGVESKVVGSGKSGTTSKGFNDYQYRIDKNIFSTSGEYEIKQATNEWNGWGSCLKPAFEPVIVARKPFKGSLVDNVINNGVGGLNIDECRVGESGGTTKSDLSKTLPSTGIYGNNMGNNYGIKNINAGRFPANVILTYNDTDYEEVCGGFPNSKGFYRPNCINNSYSQSSNVKLGGGNVSAQYNDSGSAARYFYCAKASKRDRDEGLEEFNSNTVNDGRNKSIDNPFQRGETPKKNIHPTVKPTDLMQYLVRLVTPKDGTVLDPFMGSGSTGKAVMYENKERSANYKFIGIELTEEYLPIAEARINYAAPKIDGVKAEQVFFEEVTIIDSTYTIDDYLLEVV